MAHPEHVIFDCDGVLVDSELLAMEIEESLARDLGLALKAADMARYTGRTSEETWIEIAEAHGLTLPANFADRHFDRALAVYGPRLCAVPGVEDMLQRLGLPASVASNSNKRQLKAKLEITGLSGNFGDRTYSCDDVARPKPAPDLYLHAAKRAGVDVDQCVVVEDSSTGTRAAAAAGIRVLGFIGGAHSHNGFAAQLTEAGAGLIFHDMRALPDIIAGL